MKEHKGKEQKSLVKVLREIRDKINLEIKDMSTDEVKNYYRKKRKIHPDKYDEHQHTEHNK